MSALSSPEVEERKVVRLAVVRRGEVEGKRRCLMSEEEGLREVGLWYVSDMVKEVLRGYWRGGCRACSLL